ncbi:MAG: DNA-binding protein [Bacteroidetes bacterium]|nr:DNA-binding protein [Bacteroidota bacterium]
MEIICLEEEAFYALIEKVVSQLKEKHQIKVDKWVSSTEAMSILRIKSKTTLQKLRDEGKIRFSQPEKKIILYDSDSLIKF